MPLFHIQDDDRPGHVIAADFEEAIAKWRAAVKAENNDEEILDGPRGVTCVCSDYELIRDEGWCGNGLGQAYTVTINDKTHQCFGQLGYYAVIEKAGKDSDRILSVQYRWSINSKWYSFRPGEVLEPSTDLQIVVEEDVPMPQPPGAVVLDTESGDPLKGLRSPESLLEIRGPDEEVTALRRVWLSLHIGICPNCGRACPPSAVYRTPIAIACSNCKFSISEVEIAAISKLNAATNDADLAVFIAWRTNRTLDAAKSSP